MSHEISITADGRAEAMYAEKPAWHGLGTVVQEAPSSADALRLAHLDWKVDLWPIEAIAPDGKRVASPLFATVRLDTRTVLGAVRGRYRPVQNHEAFSFLDSLVPEAEMRYESAGALKGGRLVWLLARMPETDLIDDGDELQRFVLFANSHDGTQAVRVIPTSVRVVCWNTLSLAVGRAVTSVTIRHTGDIQAKLGEVRRILGVCEERFVAFTEVGRRLASQRVSPTDAEDYWRAAWPEPTTSKAATTRWRKRLLTLRDCFRLESRRVRHPSAWHAFQAATALVDHAPRRGKTETIRLERRFHSTLLGPSATEKHRLLQLATATFLGEEAK